MSFFNLFALTVRNATLGSPALSTDITDGFFKFSLRGSTHSTKSETTYSEVVGCLIVDDSLWEIYESNTGIPVLCHRTTGAAYNALTDVVITKRRDTASIELVQNGVIGKNSTLEGLKIQWTRNLRAQNITDFAND